MADELVLKIKTEGAEATKDVKTFGDAIKGAGTDANSASDQVKKLGDETAKAGDKAKKTGEDADGLSKQFEKMATREIAERILGVAQQLEKVGDIASAVADKDLQKFQGGMEAATRVAVSVVGTVAPQFAPLVAILGTVIGKVAEWALGMQDAEAVIKSMNKQLEIHNRTLEYSSTLAKARARTSEEVFKVEQEFLQKRIDNNNAALRELIAAEMLNSDEARKLNEENEAIRLQIKVNAIEREKRLEEEAAEERKKREADAAKRGQEAAEKAAEARIKNAEEAKKEHEEELKRVDESVQKVEEGILFRSEIEEKYTQEMEDRHARAMKAIGDLDKKSGESSKKAAADAKSAADAQIKAANEAQQRVVASYTKMFDIVKTAFTDWKSAVNSVLDIVTKILIDSMTKQGAAATAGAAAVAAAQATQTGAVVAGQQAQGAASVASIPPKVSGWAASLGPIGAAMVPALIALLLGYARKSIGLEEGYEPAFSGRPPGVGRRDSFGANVAPTETVLNESNTGALKQILAALGGGAGQAVATPSTTGSQQLELLVRFVDPGVGWIRELIKMFNFQVIHRGAELVASDFVH